MKSFFSFVVIVMQFCCFSLAFSASFEDTKRAAEQGDAAAQNELGLMYDRGKGVTKDYKKAKRMSGIHLAMPVFSKGYRPKQGKAVP